MQDDKKHYVFFLRDLVLIAIALVSPDIQTFAQIHYDNIRPVNN